MCHVISSGACLEVGAGFGVVVTIVGVFTGSLACNSCSTCGWT